MDRETAKKEIRSRISCKDYLTKSKSGLYDCPYCGSGSGAHGTGALKVYDTNTWYCHACHKSGDVIDLYMKQTGADYSKALSLLAQEIGITIDPYKPTERPQSNAKGQGGIEPSNDAKRPQEAAEAPTADYTAYYAACRQRLNDPAAVEYMRRRGIGMDTARRYGLGFDPEADPANAPGAGANEHKPHPCPRIVIPCSKAHYIARSIDPTTSPAFSKMNPAGSTPAIFNARSLSAQDVQEIFVFEGAFDALSALQAGAVAIALNSAGNGKILLEQLERHRTGATLILCRDNDPDPKTAERIKKEFDELAAGLRRLKIPFIVAQEICGDFKDANEALTGNRAAFIQAVQEAQERAKMEQENAKREELERQKRTGAEMVDSFLEAVQTRKYAPSPTGITDIDRAIGGGFMRQQLILLGAAPGAGKTALAQWIFEGMAKRGTACVYLNLEMSREQILARSIARIAAQNGDRVTPTEILQGYRWTVDQEEIIKTAADQYRREIAPRMIYNPENVTANLDSILQYIEDEASTAEAAGLAAPLVVLDYLQIVTGNEREDDATVIKRAVSSLKKFAIQHNTVVFVIIAHNRAANKSGTVTMESGRDTSALEYSADLQLGLAFTECIKPKSNKSPDMLSAEERKKITLKVTKGRFAKPGTEVNLVFDGETMTYYQTANKEPPEEPRRVIRI